MHKTRMSLFTNVTQNGVAASYSDVETNRLVIGNPATVENIKSDRNVLLRLRIAAFFDKNKR